MPKTKINYIVSLLIILALCLTLSACEPVSPGGATSISYQAGSTVKLTWYLVGNKQESDTSMVLAEANKYLKDRLNVELELNVFGWGDDYEQKTNAALAAGDAIDIVFTASWADYYENAALGYFKELTRYIERYPAIKDILGESFLTGSAINGKNYAVPANKEKAHNWGFLLRKDLVEKYNMDVSSITSIEAIEPFLKTIKDNEPKITPICIAEMDAPFQLLNWNGISDEDVPGALYSNNRYSTIVNHFLASESIAHYKLMRDWANKEYIHRDAATLQNQLELMKSGQYFAASSSLKPGKAAEINSSTGIDWVQVDVTRPVMSNHDATDALLAIPERSKNPDKVFQLIELLYTDKYFKNLINYGIEDVHYEKLSENVIELIDPENSPYNPDHGWKFGDQFLDYLKSNEELDKFDKLHAYYGEALVMNSLGFVFDKTNVEDEISFCKNVVQAYYRQLFTGALEVEPTVEQFEKELRAAGVEELIAEMQIQYDAWRK